MAKLTDEHKRFIVQRLAMYDTPTMVRRAVQESYGIDVPRNQIEGYDPASHRARAGSIGKPWIQLFEATRANFREAIDDVPITNRTFRLRRLQTMHDQAMDKGNHVAAAGFLEQAAKEMGETFTNKREHKHTGTVTHVDELTTADKRAALVDRMVGAMAAAATRH